MWCTQVWLVAVAELLFHGMWYILLLLLWVKGARFFNLLPAHIRNIDADNVETFKKSLDSFLTDIPDQPTIAGQGRAAESNSLLHQIPLFMLNN